MSVNKFSVFSSWAPRAETPQLLGQRMLKNLDALTGINRYFCDWQFVDLKRDAMEMTEDNEHEFLFPLDEMRNHMTAMVENGVRQNDYGEPEPSGGYSVAASTQNADPSRYVVLNARGGGIVDPRAGLRLAEFYTHPNVAPDRSIVSYPVFRAVLLSVVSAWDVRHAQAYSADLSKLWNQPSKRFLDLAWMTYVEPALAKKVAPPRDVLVERTDDGGLLMIAAEETFDTSNPAHMAAARRIMNALARVNAEEEKTWERLWPRRRTH